ncbi:MULTISPECIES: hypothetical protein [Pedobacter]|uniref:Lipoprotein n=1 Tax=Pedobacter zeae TaxID=1737356 RepID=A0A7W6K840_9SPHI|nr:hypothetical protein [Pedobacter zeae]MBB4106855.1 hypothetical protein [Pedobacter zeae]GGH04171.1 hypothetical protein GCM10007422_19630 [Pedobacter zeae]
MKPLKFALLFFPLSLLFSCVSSTNDYAYNEKVTSIFLSQMKQIDETDSVFKDTLKVYLNGFPDSIFLSNKAENLINNSKTDLADIMSLKPSKAAEKFNNDVISYLKAINDYGKTAKQMLHTQNMNEKKKIHEQLMLKYKKLNTYPDRVLAVQKKYLNEVGLQAR